MRYLTVAGLVALAAVACGNDADTIDDEPPTDVPDVDDARPEDPPETTDEPTPSVDELSLTLSEVGEFDSPISIVNRPDDTALFVAERAGRVLRLQVTGEGVDRSYATDDEPVVDISDEVITDSELGLLDIEFSPDGDRLYLSYSAAPGGDTRIVSYPFDGQTVDGAARRHVLGIDQPFGNHNGGGIEFGPEGYLYVALGDGGGGGDPLGAGQDTSTWLGAMLRIDPESTLGSDEPYAIPDDNPFAGGIDGQPEIWLYGVRNPWQFSFDTATGDLWVADVGQNAWEEVNWLPAAEDGGRGANLGWNQMEGSQPYEGGSNPPDGVLPVFDYPIPDEGCAVIGGVVYRGDAIAGLEGTYLFGDYCNATLRALDISNNDVRALWLDGLEVDTLVAFGEDNDGEVYLVSLAGSIYRLDP